MLNSNIKATGTLNILLKDESGAVKDDILVNNLVVSSGLAFITSRMKDTTDAAMTHMAIGEGTTAAAAGDTALGSQAAIVSLTSTTVSTNTIVYEASFGAGVGTGAITEAGIFNAASSGTMLCRTVFSVVNKGADDSMVITWTITLSAS